KHPGTHASFWTAVSGEPFSQYRPNGREMLGHRLHELVAAVVDENVGVVAGVLGRTEQGAEIIWNSFYCPSPLTAGRALGALGPVAIPGLAGHQAGDDIGGDTRRLMEEGESPPFSF